MISKPASSCPSRTRGSGGRRSPALRDLDADVLEIVLARAVHADQIEWLSATCGAGDCGSVLGAMLIVSPVESGPLLADSVGVAWLDPTSSEGNVCHFRVGAFVAAVAVGLAVALAAAHRPALLDPDRSGRGRRFHAGSALPSASGSSPLLGGVGERRCATALRAARSGRWSTSMWRRCCTPLRSEDECGMWARGPAGHEPPLRRRRPRRRPNSLMR